jgi:hypothetical protein
MRARVIASILLAAAVVAVAPAVAKPRGDDKDRKSKNGHAEGSIGAVKVTIEYGRPSVKGRKIWGDLVPYDKVWRAGADEATTVAFDQDVMVEGQRLAAGTYAFFAIPTAGGWTAIFNKTADQWGAFDYDAKSDALRVTVQPKAHDMVETLEYAVGAGGFELRWEKLAVPVAVKPAS